MFPRFRHVLKEVTRKNYTKIPQNDNKKHDHLFVSPNYRIAELVKTQISVSGSLNYWSTYERLTNELVSAWDTE